MDSTPRHSSLAKNKECPLRWTLCIILRMRTKKRLTDRILLASMEPMRKPAASLPQQTPRKKLSPRKKKLLEVGISKRSEEMLHSIYQFRYVTALDMTRLFYTPTSINHVRE